MKNQEVKYKTYKRMGVEDCQQLDQLDKKTCKILKETCFVLTKGKKRRCAFSEHLEYLESSSLGKPEAEKIREEVLHEATKRWKQHAQQNALGGRKDMTAMPLEKAVRSAIRRAVEPLAVPVTDRGEKLYFHDKSFWILADCLVSKDKPPTSIISIKTWLSPEAIRETFAYSYLAKYWYGQRNSRVFMVGLNPTDEFAGLIDAFKPYLDGVYSLSGEPYIDDLLEELRRIYV